MQKNIEDMENPLYCPLMLEVTKPKIFVGCNEMDSKSGKCETCGWNPKVSHQRLVRRFGTEITKEFEAVSNSLSWYPKKEEESTND